MDYGQKLGKTIIFAKRHDHAEKILEVFHREYPHLPDFAKVIDNRISYAQSAIDEFSDPKKMPQIAISVDMLDTGIDVPEVVNLVFFKKVLSKAKFWQMIGRGTRLCPGLLDGEDKERFYIFDFYGNFDFFRMNKGKAAGSGMALQEAVFNLKFEISYKLQDVDLQADQLITYRNELVKEMSEKVRELPRDNFAVRQHLKYVDLNSVEVNYRRLTYEDTRTVKEELAPLILPGKDEAGAVRFDALLSVDWKESELESDQLKNYKEKAEFYIRQHQDHGVIAKLRGNEPLTAEDVELLEGILWKEIGTKADYEQEIGQKPLGEFVRGIVGLDMRAAKDAFSEYLDGANLDGRQIYFVNQIVEYIVKNGMMKDLSVLQEPPFTDKGSVADIFTDLSIWTGIRKVIDRINGNAVAA